VSRWKIFRNGKSTVSIGQPFYGQPKIVCNAPLSVENFDTLIAALTEAKLDYRRGLCNAEIEDGTVGTADGARHWDETADGLAAAENREES
jgi:hypothetical protein